MLTYILRRLLLMIPTLFGMTVVVFVVLSMAPGGIGQGSDVDAGGPRARRFRSRFSKSGRITKNAITSMKSS